MKYRILVILLITIVFFQFISSGCHNSGNTIEIINPDNSNIQYSGRINFSDVKAPVLYWPGTSITANFHGTSIKILLEDLYVIIIQQHQWMNFVKRKI